MKTLRNLLRRDVLCQGCWKQGSSRWFRAHPCPERDALEAEVRRIFGDGLGRYY